MSKCIGLYRVEENGYHHWLFEGTEHLVRYPKHNFTNPSMGLMSFGTVKIYYGKEVDPRIIYKASIEDIQRLKTCGWETIGQGTHYAYVTRGDLR